MPFIPLSQRDQQWASQKLGSSNLTVGRFGCTTTCISMLSSYFNCFLSPGQIASRKEFYTKEGLIDWPKLSFSRMVFTERPRVRDDLKIMESVRSPDKGVLLNVNDGAHWVLAIRKTLFGNDYVVWDPWTGKKTTACGSYHNIVGSAHFKRA